MTETKFIQLKQGIEGDIYLGGSKSYTNRALVLGALATGNTVLHNYSSSDDSQYLIEALRSLQIKIELRNDDSLCIEGCGGNFTPYVGKIHVGMAGTTLRFLIPLCCLIGGEILLEGSRRLHERPIRPLVDAMRSLGAHIEYRGQEGCAPILIKGFRGDIGEEVMVDGGVSSQFISSLLLCSACFPRGLKLSICGKKISQSYIAMTRTYLEKFGVQIENYGERGYKIDPQQVICREVLIEGDATGAAYFWGLAAVAQGRIRVHNISKQSEQGDVRFVKFLEEMGCELAYGDNWIEVSNNNTLQAIDCDMTLLPDSAQTLAVVASVAMGQTHITGLSTLKFKESDRCRVVCDELRKMDIHGSYDDESITIIGGRPRGGAVISTYDDHRVAMSFAVLGCVDGGVHIEDPQVVAKSFPDFWEKLQSLQ